MKVWLKERKTEGYFLQIRELRFPTAFRSSAQKKNSIAFSNCEKLVIGKEELRNVQVPEADELIITRVAWLSACLWESKENSIANLLFMKFSLSLKICDLFQLRNCYLYL